MPENVTFESGWSFWMRSSNCLLNDVKLSFWLRCTVRFNSVQYLPSDMAAALCVHHRVTVTAPHLMLLNLTHWNIHLISPAVLVFSYLDHMNIPALSSRNPLFTRSWSNSLNRLTTLDTAHIQNFYWDYSEQYDELPRGFRWKYRSVAVLVKLFRD